MKSAPAIAFDFAPSRIVIGALVTMAVLAAFAPWFSALPTLARVAATLSISTGAWLALRRFAERRFDRIAFGVAGWTLVDAGKVEHAAILKSHVRLGLCIALVFRYGRRRRFGALLLPDNCDRDTRRRVALLLSASADRLIVR